MTKQVDPNAAVMNLPRRDARDKLLGRTKYTIDAIEGVELQAVLLRAEVPSAKIREINLSAAREMPGVKAIATYDDAPGLHGLGITDTPIFA